MHNITRITLPNGLNVLLKEIHTAPLISAWVWYRVGSKDEPPGHTGLSHWVEHMQFKGTPQFPGSLMDKAIAREGGIWNAFTYIDWTAYYETLPADKIDLALRLEADRMTNSVFDPAEVESERTVIMSEREGDENEPLFLLGEALQQTAFSQHPYNHQVIGFMDDLRTITRDDLYNHYRTYYTPGNAVLALAGDFDTPKMLARIRELYETLPAAPAPARLQITEPEPESETRIEVNGPGETTFIQVAYRAPAANHPDIYPLAVLDSLLSGPSNPGAFGGTGISNKTSRLYRALVETEQAVSVYGSLPITIDPFLYTITLTVHPQRSPAQTLGALDEQIDRILQHRVEPHEVARAIKQARAIFAYGSENITNQAAWLGYSEMFATYDWFLNYLDNLAAVTPQDILRVAQRYLRPQRRVVATYHPQPEEMDE